MFRTNVVVNRLVFIAVCAAALLPVTAGGRLDSLYARLDKAIASSDAYVARREARIAALRQRMGKARGAEAYGVAMSLYAEYKPYMNDSALVWLDRRRRRGALPRADGLPVLVDGNVHRGGRHHGRGGPRGARQRRPH